MLSATTLFRATEPGSAERHTGGGDPNGVGVARAAARTVLRDWIGQCEGFQMIGPDGRIGVVTKVETIRGCDLSVATGLFVIRQVSIREGFGLVVSEALWKRTPVVATRAAGIPLQMSSGAGGFLVDSTVETAEPVAWLLDNPGEAAQIATRGQQRVRERFLLPRLIADNLGLFRHAIDGRAGCARGGLPR